MSQRNFSRLDNGLLDRLCRQRMGSEDINIANSSKISLKFANVLKFFKTLSFSSFVDLEGE